jgi:hypothetical protein
MARCNVQAPSTPAGDAMGPKLLFVLGIVVTHGALGAAWVRGSAPEARPISTCANAPAPQPHFEPQAELLAMRVSTVTSLDSLQP